MESFRRGLASLLFQQPGSAGGSSEGSPNSNRRQLFRQLHSRQYWMPDAVSTDCYECSAKFNTFRRKHHCRVCGQIFCYKCCSVFISGRLIDCPGSLRVCTFCYNFFETHLNQGNSDVVNNGDVTALIERRLSIAEPGGAAGGPPLLAFDSGGTADQSLSVGNFFLRDPRQLELLLDQIMGEDGVETGTRFHNKKMYYNCFSGEELVEWIRRRDNGVSEVDLAKTICQGLLDNGFIQCLLGSLRFEYSSVPYKTVPVEDRSQQQQHSSGLQVNSSSSQDESSGPEWLKNLESSTGGSFKVGKNAGEDDPKRGSKSLSVDAELPDMKAMVASRAVAAEEDESADSDATARENLDTFYSNFVQTLLKQYLKQEGLEHDKWFQQILLIVRQVVANVDPNYRTNGDEMDIRTYVKIKKVVGGEVSESGVLTGEVFSGRVVRQGMPLKIRKPKILLVRGSISFHRNDEKYVSLANLQRQEEEYVKNICNKIHELGPEVILVENTVCGAARDALEDVSIALILNVKLKVLERLARYFQITIFESIGSMMTMPKLGVCEMYSNRQYEMPRGDPKSLVFLESNRKKLGCTVLLRGGLRAELIRVKRIMKRLILVQSSGRYEKALLMNISAKPLPVLCEDNAREFTLSPLVRVEMRQQQERPAVRVNFEQPTSAKITKKKALPKTRIDRPEPALIKMRLTSGMGEDDYQELISDYRANVGYRLPQMSTYPQHCDGDSSDDDRYSKTHLDTDRPFPVLFSSFAASSRAAPFYCIMPWIVNMQFYSISDIPLGAFLETFCFSNKYACPNNRVCGQAMSKHVRRFCHGSCSVTMKVQEYEESSVSNGSDGEEHIMTWKYCLRCKVSTTMVPMSNDMYMYSYAMFLLLLFYDEDTVSRRGGGEGGKLRCQHPIHRGEHVTCYSKKNIVANFSTCTVHSLEVVLPSKRISIPKDKPDMKSQLEEENRSLNVQGPSIFNCILEEVLRLKSCGVTAVEERLAQLTTEHETDYASYRELQRSINCNVDTEDNIRSKELIFKTKHFLADCLLKWRKHLTGLHELKKRERPRVSSLSSTAESLEFRSRKIDEWRTSAPNFEAVLASPFQPNLHYNVSPTQKLVVDERQPSSLIAHTLSTPEYEQYIQRLDNPDGASELSDQSIKQDFECQYSDDTCKFYCCAYFAREFHRLRSTLFEPSSDFVRSIAECKPWEASGGKSGMAFYKSSDERFVLKQMSKFEFQSFQTFAQNYFQYVDDSIQKERPTSLAKIVGVFRIGFKNSSTTNNSFKIDILIIENLFYGKDIKSLDTYDLKGSIRNRMVETSGKTDSSLVLLDENLLKVACSKPLYISYESKQALLEAINIDSEFLARNSMMDYSLLVGIDNDKHELVIGIIDYIRTFTWDKKIETLVKSSGFLGGAGKSPTVISPNLYQTRFRDAMFRYFILIPDFYFKDTTTTTKATEPSTAEDADRG